MIYLEDITEMKCTSCQEKGKSHPIHGSVYIHSRCCGESTLTCRFSPEGLVELFCSRCGSPVATIVVASKTNEPVVVEE